MSDSIGAGANPHTMILNNPEIAPDRLAFEQRYHAPQDLDQMKLTVTADRNGGDSRILRGRIPFLANSSCHFHVARKIMKLPAHYMKAAAR